MPQTAGTFAQNVNNFPPLEQGGWIFWLLFAAVALIAAVSILVYLWGVVAPFVLGLLADLIGFSIWLFQKERGKMIRYRAHEWIARHF